MGKRGRIPRTRSASAISLECRGSGAPRPHLRQGPLYLFIATHSPDAWLMQVKADYLDASYTINMDLPLLPLHAL